LWIDPQPHPVFLVGLSRYMSSSNETTQSSQPDQLASVLLLPPVFGLVWLYFISQKPLLFAMDAMSTCGLVIVLASAVLVGVDAGKLGFGTEETTDSGGWWQKQSPVAWGVACALLWFPMYMVYGFIRVKRGGANRAVVTMALAVLFAVAYFGMYSMIDAQLSDIRSMLGR